MKNVEVCKLVENYAKTARLEERCRIIDAFLSSGGSEEDAVNMLAVSKEDVEKAKEIMARQGGV